MTQQAKPPRLIQRYRELLQTRHYARRTVKTYEQWLRRYLRFHRLRHPREMGSAEVNAFLSHLAVEEQVSASTQNQALAALLFLYRDLLGQELELDDIVRARTRQRKAPGTGRRLVRWLTNQGIPEPCAGTSSSRPC
jgi:site-specific recombinase XerD